MSKRERFPEYIAQKAFKRQHGLCAMCGKTLVKSHRKPSLKGAWQPHHVNGDSKDHRLANCACLCLNPPERCHLEAHDGDYGCDTILASTFFDYWNG
ncbi:MAG TPA: hypothetical protein VLX91_09655 [Candidatus Acidoferrales bacterium]|nr:hypothetical protein [Candidatus Acidoferrales bacterium]